jgi:hypothetical protein
MTLLDRFRTPATRPNNPDPVARLAFVSEIPLQERETIAAIAREDDDPRVRRAAVAKLLDPASLKAVASADPDESVRASAHAMLRDLAVEAFEGTGESEALAAVEALDEPRVLTQVARTAPRDSVALQALARLGDPHAIGGVARHAISEAARRSALEALRDRGDHAELLSVALNSEFKDTALAALDQLTTREDLEQVAQRGHNKSAVKRARTLLRAPESADQEPQETPTAAEATSGARLQPDLSETASGAETESGVRLQPDLHVSSEAESHLQSSPDPAAPAIAEAAARVTAARVARLAELAQMAAAAAGESDLTAAEKGLRRVRREWQEVSVGVPVEPEIAAQVAQAEAAVAARTAEAREADASRRREALARVQQVVRRVEPLAAHPDLTRRGAERALREARSLLGSFPALTTRQEAEDLIARLKAAVTALGARAAELREAEEWKRWANVTMQEQLCARMEALAAKENPEEIGKAIRDLQMEWRLAADVPRERAEALWQRFKAAHDAAWAKCQEYVAAEAVARADNLAKKTALCERAEALADSTAWIQTAEALKALQLEWKSIGPVSRGHEKAVWERFRAACDRFFTRRHDDLTARKKLWAENLAKKTALCERAEALAGSTEWDQAASEVKRLQAEWKTIGPVKKSRSDAVWQRFHGACDRFFARYAARHDEARAERVAAREAICAELEALVASTAADAEPPAGLPTTLRAARGRWQQEIAARGVDPDRARVLDARFQAATAAVVARWPAAFAGTELDPDANRKRMEALVRKVEDLAASLLGPVTADTDVTPAEHLARMLKEALAANTIGGKLDEQSRWREAADEVRKAQAAWSRLGSVAADDARALGDRFQKAARTIMERAGGTGRAGQAGRG